MTSPPTPIPLKQQLEEQLLEQTRLELDKQQRVLVCPMHQRPLDVYCESCEELVCVHCTIRRHKDHDCDPITDDSVYHKHMQQIQQLIPPAKEKLASVKEAIQALIKRSEEVVRIKERVWKEIEDIGQQANAEYTAGVQERVRNQKEELEERAKEKLGFLSTRKVEAVEAATLLEGCLDYIKNLVTIGSRQQILANKREIVDRLELVMLKVKVESLNPTEETGLALDAEKQASKLPGTIDRVRFHIGWDYVVMEKKWPLRQSRILLLWYSIEQHYCGLL